MARFLSGRPRYPKIDELRKHLSGGVTADLEGWLVQPREGVPYHEGSVVPVLGLRVHRRPSGLYVVGGLGDPYPIDLMAVYLTATDVFGHPLSQGDLNALLDGADAGPLLEACALLLHAHHHGNGLDLEVRIIEEILLRDTRARAVNMLRSGDRRLIAPQLILLVAAGSLLALPWLSESSEALRLNPIQRSILLSLHIGDLLQSKARGDDGEETLFANVTGSLALEIVANQIFNSATHLRSDMARHERIWHGIASEVAQGEGLPDLSEMFKEVTGVSIDVFEAVGFGLYAAKSEQPPFVARAWFRDTSLAPDDLAAVERLVCVTPKELREALASDLDGNIAGNRWKLRAFSRWPLLRFDDDRRLVHSPQLLVDRFFGGRAFFDAWFKAGAIRDRAKHAWGLATEQYGYEVLRSIAPDRIYTEDDLTAACEAPGQRIADAAIDYGAR